MKNFRKPAALIRAAAKNLACALVAACSAGALAQAPWPARPITYVVPFPAGGTTDVLARLIAQKLGPALGTSVIVDNRAGAGGNIGSDYVAKSAPDGYTILGGTISSHAINQSLYARLPYDAVRSFAPITLIGTNANVLVVNAASSYQTVADIVTEAKKKPGTLSFASAGNGTSQHLSGELFKSIAAIDIVHVPYKGSSPALQDVMAGQVPLMFDTTVAAAPFIQSARLRPLAVTSRKRVGHLPNVPTMIEAGVPGYEIVSWQALFAPAATPQPVIKRLHAEIAKILAEPEMRERFDKLGMEASGMTPAQFADFQKAEIVKWGRVVKTAGIKVD